MNPVGRADIERLAELARLEVEASALESLTSDMTAIIEYVSQINGVSPERAPHSSDIDPPETAIQLRHDEPEPAASVQDPSSFAPCFESGFFVVPRPESMGDG